MLYIFLTGFPPPMKFTKTIYCVQWALCPATMRSHILKMYENVKVPLLQQTNRQTNGPRVGMSLHSDTFLL